MQLLLQPGHKCWQPMFICQNHCCRSASLDMLPWRNRAGDLKISLAHWEARIPCLQISSSQNVGPTLYDNVVTYKVLGCISGAFLSICVETFVNVLALSMMTSDKRSRTAFSTCILSPDLHWCCVVWLVIGVWHFSVSRGYSPKRLWAPAQQAMQSWDGSKRPAMKSTNTLAQIFVCNVDWPICYHQTEKLSLADTLSITY